jgi:PAS domain S-box-containing protein
VATSLAFLGVVVVIACDLAGKALRAGRLTDALGESEARYRGLLDGAIEGLFQTSPAGKLLMANPALARMLGYASVAEVVATITDSAAQVWVDPAERSRLLELLEAQGTVRGYECQFRRKDGTSIWVSLSSQAVRGPDGRVHRFEGFAEDVTERRRTRDALLAGEARLISAVDAAGLGFYEAEVDGRLCFLDERVRELLGIPLGEESRGRDYWLNHIHPEDLPGVLEKSQGLLAGRLTQVDGEYRYRHPSRGLLWIHHRSRVLARDASGRMVRLLGVLQDITERKEAEEALKRVSHQNALILGAAAEGIIGLDLQGKHTFVSPAAASMLGYAPEDLLGRDSHSLWHHSNKHGSPYPKDECPICASYREGATRHVSSEVFWRQDGTCFPVDYRCTPIGEHGSTLGAVLTFEDITSRRKAEEALRTSQARLASGVELAGLGFYEMVEGEDVIYTDDRMRSVCGLPPDAARGVPAARFWLEHIHPDDQRRILDADQRLGDGRLDRISAEYRYLHPDGHERWLHHLAVVSRRDSAGQPAHTRGVVRDITEQKRVEQELARQRLQLAHVARVSTMGQLASSLAHELNQPLGAILRNAEAAELLLANPSPDIAELQAILADIRGDDHRAGEVIDRLRAFLKRREIERHPVDFGSLASETITLVRPDAERRGVRLGLQAGAPLRPVLGDRVQLQQVLLNLLLNAMDAVEGKPRGERRVSVRIRSMDAVIEVSVEDNGPGIPADAIQRVFEPFYTSKPHGLGMGLSIARGIVETHGGRLRVENSPDGGATFTFTLPAGSE